MFLTIYKNSANKSSCSYIKPSGWIFRFFVKKLLNWSVGWRLILKYCWIVIWSEILWNICNRPKKVDKNIELKMWQNIFYQLHKRAKKLLLLLIFTYRLNRTTRKTINAIWISSFLFSCVIFSEWDLFLSSDEVDQLSNQ